MMTNREVFDTFYLPEDADAFARLHGWEDADQMCYYEDMVMQEQAQAAQAPHELEGVDSREVYADEGDHIEWALAIHTDDLAGVY